jgi:hypothetical protein
MKQVTGLTVILLCLWLLDTLVHNEGQRNENKASNYDQYEEDAINKQRDLDTLKILNHINKKP